MHSSKRTDKSFWLSTYWFNIVGRFDPKRDDLGHFWLIPSHIEVGMKAFNNRSGYKQLIILWFITLKYDGWALIGAWVAIGMNTVFVYFLFFVI